jgi:predicted MFS family arabinose efflux permease
MATRFIVAAGISFYGDWLTTVALVVLLYRVTGSATGPALYILVRIAPRVLGPAPGGVLADRMGPVRIVVTCATAQSALTGAIALFAHYRVVPAIYVAVAGAQFLNSLAQPSYSAMIPRLAPKEQLGRINGLYSSLFASSILVSPAIGALILPHTTPELLIVADAGSFLIAAALLASLHPAQPAESDLHSSRGITAGVPIVLRDGMLRSLAAGYLANAAVITALQAVLVVAASQHFGHDVDVGWLYAAVGSGGLLGAVPVIRRTPRYVGRLGIVMATLGEMVPLALFVLVTNLAVAMLLLLLSSVAGTLYQTRGWVGLQQRVAPDLLGRTSAVIRFSMYVGMLAGAVAAVTMVQALGWQATVLIVIAACFVLLVASTLYGPGERPGHLVTPIDWPPL